MTVSTIPVTGGSGYNIWTESRTVSAVVREAQIFQQGESTYSTFSVRANQITLATSASHILFIQADGTNYTRLKRVLFQPVSDIPAAASAMQLSILRTSTAGTGGTALTAQPYDSADSYAGGSQTLPTVKGTEGVLLYDFWIPLPSALGDHLDTREWHELPGMKPIIFGTGTGAGICFKVVTGVASCSLTIMAEITTTTYL